MSQQPLKILKPNDSRAGAETWRRSEKRGKGRGKTGNGPKLLGEGVRTVSIQWEMWKRTQVHKILETKMGSKAPRHLDVMGPGV